LVDEAVWPFRFLDIACGDARATVDALKGTRVAHYHGIDLSQAALDLASKALEALACPVTLDHRDFVEALRDRPEPVDVAWIGLSLHHLLAEAKLTLMREIRGVVGDSGLFLIYEPASTDDEDREAWLLRWERQNQPLWTALTPEEYEAMTAHVRANDFPETTSRWHSLGHEAGFDRVLVGDFLDRFALEGDNRELFHVQKIIAFDIFVPLRKSGVQRVGFDVECNRRFVRSRGIK